MYVWPDLYYYFFLLFVHSFVCLLILPLPIAIRTAPIAAIIHFNDFAHMKCTNLRMQSSVCFASSLQITSNWIESAEKTTPFSKFQSICAFPFRFGCYRSSEIHFTLTHRRASNNSSELVGELTTFYAIDLFECLIVFVYQLFTQQNNGQVCLWFEKCMMITDTFNSP